MIRSVRIQLSRRKGFNLQEVSRALNGLEAVSCARPHTYGNPFPIAFCEAWFGLGPAEARRKSIDLHRQWLDGELDATWESKKSPTQDEIVADLKGKNLACVCSLDQPCHVDTLIDRANR